MTRRVTSGFALLLALGCNSQTKADPNGDSNPAGTALQALTARDEQVVAQCGQAVQRCEQQLPDAAPSSVCQKLLEHCGELQAHLEDVRAHVVGCLNGVQACQEHAPEQAHCSRDVSRCEPLAEGADEDRDTLLQCSDKVQSCLLRVASLPEAAAVSCENMAVACERVSELLEQAGQERAQGDAKANEHARDAHDAMDAIDQADDDDADEVDGPADDSDDDADDADQAPADDDADDADDAAGNEAHGAADAGAGKGRKAASGEDIDD
ncbi:MAG TPA: hypothetical protein VJU61_10355 [Polyangiaceae bacterium]|nr:hypothetical protein [Polyangiaceae bacterium]